MKNDRNSRKTAVLQSEKGLSRNHFRLILILIAIIVIALIAHGILRPDRNASLKIIYTGKSVQPDFNFSIYSSNPT